MENNPADKLKNVINKIGIKKFLIICTVIIIFIITIIISISIMSTKNNNNKTTAIVFQHEYLVNFTAGDVISKQIKTDLEEIIADANEIKTAPSKNSAQQPFEDYIFYHVEFLEDSLKTLSTKPDKIYQIKLKTTDERTYTVHYRLSYNYGMRYFVLVVDRDDKRANNDFAFIHTNKDKYKPELENWIKTFNLNNPTIKTKSLELPITNQNYDEDDE